MRRVFFPAAVAALVALTSAIAVPALADVVSETMIVTPSGERLNLRAGPSSDYDKVRVMARGEVVEIIDAKKSWVNIIHESGDEGWCAVHHLTRPGAGGPSIFAATGARINLRAGPGTGNDVVAKMLNGQRIELLDSDGDWSRVRLVDGPEGWVSTRYIVN